ncbi:TPR-like protein [Aspergillus heteromorphus CBS 117.55]|uniref:TPR-like protein n=1 Tax=Aspergillus heteromorphus CBS 117.55 TaxID=1448321 RepID=A0A317VXT9_9EURO|nr:TPR-like protein [Aspergillus heteromorphus CBS 117.55]PWY79174.1 TPR-like protein [Aspergillus heteromorphus CBS 117.55]
MADALLHTHTRTPHPSSPPLPPPYDYNLGTHRRPITTTSPDAQLWFDRGLLWAFSFNHEQAVQCFTRATEYDATCTLAHWGIAYAIGPNYNKAWSFFDPADLRTSVEKAHEALAQSTFYANASNTPATPLEQTLQTALLARFPALDKIPSPADMKPYDHAYADAMRPVYHAHPNDMDIAALFVEALMCISPRALWNLETGEPSGPHTVEARAVIEKALAQPSGRHHPALCHLYIHLMEMSPYPEIALPAADRLRRLAPDASHMLHMPTHIDMAVGDYRRSIDSNQEAIEADDKYFASMSGSALYVAYRVHNIMAKLYSAFISGRSEEAVSAAQKLEEVIDLKVLTTTSPPMADWTESFLGNIAHVLVRFGRWEEILALELPAEETRELYCTKTANILYARAIALSALGRVGEAEEARETFEAARRKVPDSRINSLPVREVEVLAVASQMLTGELEYRKGNFEVAFAALRKGVELEDALPYCDPPAWMLPVRHALGGLLLEQKRVGEAERVFREDVGMAEGFPRRKGRLNNVWGLHGLHECLVALGKVDEARCVEVQRDVAIGSADVPITTSCYCRLSAVDGKCCSAGQ